MNMDGRSVAEEIKEELYLKYKEVDNASARIYEMYNELDDIVYTIMELNKPLGEELQKITDALGHFSGKLDDFIDKADKGGDEYDEI